MEGVFYAKAVKLNRRDEENTTFYFRFYVNFSISTYIEKGIQNTEFKRFFYQKVWGISSSLLSFASKSTVETFTSRRLRRLIVSLLTPV